MLDGALARVRHTTVRLIERLLPELLLTPDGAAQVGKLGHRAYVGGEWETVGKASFEFLRTRGLRPDHVLLDIACGALRLGVHAIPYLDSGKYLGIEKEALLLEAGQREELDMDVLALKRPELIVSDSFEFGRFSKRPDYAVAFSLFSHLPPDAIDLCFKRLREVLPAHGQFFATFIERQGFWRNPARSNDFAAFRYTPAEMLAFGTRNGFEAEHVPQWREGARQSMVRFVLAE